MKVAIDSTAVSPNDPILGYVTISNRRTAVIITVDSPAIVVIINTITDYVAVDNRRATVVVAIDSTSRFTGSIVG